MRATTSLFVLALLAPHWASQAIAAGDSTIARSAVTARAEVRPRASVVQSTGMLHFVVRDANQPADASLTFTAGARAGSTSAVRLLATTEAALQIVDGQQTALTLISVDQPRTLGAGETVQAVEWTGGGVRSGQLHFQLRAAPGLYSIPVRLQIIVP